MLKIPDTLSYTVQVFLHKHSYNKYCSCFDFRTVNWINKVSNHMHNSVCDSSFPDLRPTASILTFRLLANLLSTKTFCFFFCPFICSFTKPICRTVKTLPKIILCQKLGMLWCSVMLICSNAVMKYLGRMSGTLYLSFCGIFVSF